MYVYVLSLEWTPKQGYGKNAELRNVEGKMRNGKCGKTVIGPQVRPCDSSYYAVYRVIATEISGNLLLREKLQTHTCPVAF